ncbi:MAG: EamA family transporter [Candidatus Woesearchaeota archaeon]
MNIEIWAIELVIISTLISAFATILMKIGSDKLSLNIISLIKNHELIVGAVLFVFSFSLFIPALRGGELSILFPVSALSYIWVNFLSSRYLKERITSKKWIGAVLLLIGVVFLAIV